MIAAQLARGFALKRQTSNPDGERDVEHGRSCIDTQGVPTCVICIGASSAAFAAEADEEDAAKPSIPNVYLDLRTSFAAIPAGTLGLGFGSSSLSTAREALAALKGTSFPRGLPAAQSIAVDLPLPSTSAIACRSMAACSAERPISASAAGRHLPSRAGVSVSRLICINKTAKASRPSRCN
jgi:hypothetical protein